MRVLVVEAIAPEGLAYLREHGVDVDELAKPSPAELRARLPDYEGLITRSGTAVTAELLDHAPRLRIVGRAGVGVDNVDVEACSRRGIVVCNAPYGNVVSAAEHTLGMLLALVRRIPEAHARLKALEWNRGIYGAELYRKTVGVVGLGKVGSRVAVRLRGFETDVVVYDPYIPESRAKDLGARAVDFETLLREADIVTFHVPLTPETENMVAARELARMKRGVRLVNCARGGIVNEADLLAALESEHVAGVAIDVWSEEPPAGEPLRRLIQHPRVVVTPHLGANSGEAQVNVAVDVARQLVAFRDGGLVEHAVNIPLGDPAAVAELRPFVALADRLGRFSVQLDPEPPRAPRGDPRGRDRRGGSRAARACGARGASGPRDGGPRESRQRAARGGRARCRGPRHARDGDRGLHERADHHDAHARWAQDHRRHRLRRSASNRASARPRHRVHARGPHPGPLL